MENLENIPGNMEHMTGKRVLISHTHLHTTDNFQLPISPCTNYSELLSSSQRSCNVFELLQHTKTFHKTVWGTTSYGCEHLVVSCGTLLCIFVHSGIYVV